MIIGIGTDIVEVKRVLDAAKKVTFIEKFFTKEEQKIFDRKPSSIAGNFAVKEAVAKMFGTGFRGFALKDIEVLRDEEGKPYIVLYNNAEEISKEQNIKKIHVSISDTDTYAIAYVIGEGS
jgi:holo-[acyl-carrier protein] synthase